MTTKDTMFNFMGAFPDHELDYIVTLVNTHTDVTCHRGSLPFVARETVLVALWEESEHWNDWEQHAGARIQKCLDIKTWVDITSFQDTHRKELNVITGEIREAERLGGNIGELRPSTGKL